MNGFWEIGKNPTFDPFRAYLGEPRSSIEDPYICIIYEFLIFPFVRTIPPEKTKISLIFSEKGPKNAILRIFWAHPARKREFSLECHTAYNEDTYLI